MSCSQSLWLKCAILPSNDVIHSTKFGSNMMEKDISANLYQKCLILYSTILLSVLHNTSATVWLPWQRTRFQVKKDKVCIRAKWPIRPTLTSSFCGMKRVVYSKYKAGNTVNQVKMAVRTHLITKTDWPRVQYQIWKNKSRDLNLPRPRNPIGKI